MADVDLAQMVKDQAVIIAGLQEQVAAVSARLPVEEVTPAPGAFAAFPRVVYKKGHKKGQIDHPGNLSKIVIDQAALDAALQAGWALEHVPGDLEAEEQALADADAARAKAAAKKKAA